LLVLQEILRLLVFFFCQAQTRQSKQEMHVDVT